MTVQDHGRLPAWRQLDLPEPLPFSPKNILRTIGPGAILLAGAIGGGEWIVGPLTAVKYGPAILWLATLGIVLQVIFNVEAVRYTLYTGEPILTGCMRLSPGPWLWGTIYVVAGAAQLATPAMAKGCAQVLFAACAGRMPTPSDAPLLGWVGTGIILLTVGILVSGKKIERVLELASWLMIALIFTFLIVVNILVVPTATWLSTLRGFVVPGFVPREMDLLLLASFVATAGSGGLGNLAISNWFRDKGFGMGQHAGSISGALAAEQATLQPVGAIFPVTPSNLSRWKTWWRYTLIDQQGVWAIGCIIGMFLNVNLAMALVNPGEELGGYDAGAFQARLLAEKLWSGLWFLTLLNGFWILFSTHLGNTDCLVRTVSDMIWAAVPAARRWSAGQLYGAILATLTLWSLYAIHLGSVLDLFKILAVLASPILALAAFQILRVNTRFLPVELRPGWVRRIGLVAVGLFYGGVSVALVWQMMQAW